MNYATKMLDWGDNVVGFQHARDVQGWIQPVSCVRFYLQQPDRVEVHFSTTIAYGGGVQHSAEGSVVLRREHAAELGAMLVGSDPIGGDLVRKMTEAGVTMRDAPNISTVAAGAHCNVAAVAAGILGKSKQLQALRIALDTRPGPDGSLKDWQNWSRVTDRLLEGL